VGGWVEKKNSNRIQDISARVEGTAPRGRPKKGGMNSSLRGLLFDVLRGKIPKTSKRSPPKVGGGGGFFKCPVERRSAPRRENRIVLGGGSAGDYHSMENKKGPELRSGGVRRGHLVPSWMLGGKRMGSKIGNDMWGVGREKSKASCQVVRKKAVKVGRNRKQEIKLDRWLVSRNAAELR